MKYTKTFRDSILRKVLPPENRSVSSVSKEMGVAVVTINSWLAKLKNGTLSLEEDGGTLKANVFAPLYHTVLSQENF